MKAIRYVNNSGMLLKFNLFFRLFAFIFFKNRKIPKQSLKMISEIPKNSQIVYLIPNKSWLDYFFLNYIFLKYNLPLSRFIPVISMLFLAPFSYILKYFWFRLTGKYKKPEDKKWHFKYYIKKGEPVTLFLREPDTILQFGESGRHLVPYLAELVRLQKDLNRKIYFVPITILWKKGVSKYKRGLIDRVFGDPTAPGAARKFFMFLFNFRKATVQIHEPLSYDRVLESIKNSESYSPEELADEIRIVLKNTLFISEQIIHGPPLKSANQIISEIMRNEDFKADLLKNKIKLTPKNLKKIEKYLKEIAADFKFRSIEFLGVMVSFLTDKLYKGVIVDEDGIERIRKAGKEAPLVIVPCHRSHFDYLAISNILYQYGLIPPHIVAGINLSFWPIGKLFRHCGAFFIRRSFKGNKIYALTLKWYIAKLLKEGYWIEFFIEGGRSRTGKLLHPKFGILNYIVDCYLSGVVPEIKFVPIYIGYEKIIEDESYLRELSGKEKKKEDLGGLIKSIKVFQSKYGKVFFNVGSLINMNEFYQNFEEKEKIHEEKEVKRRFIRKLAYTIEDNINQSAVITVTSVTAMALSTVHGKGFSLARLLERIGYLLFLFQKHEKNLSKTFKLFLNSRRDFIIEKCGELGITYPLDKKVSPEVLNSYSKILGETVKEGVLEAINLFARHHIIKIAVFENEKMIEFVEEKRIKLDIYKNTSIHFLLNIAIVSLILASEKPGTSFEIDKVIEESGFISWVFKYEFVYPVKRDLKQNVMDVLHFYEKFGFVNLDEKSVSVNPDYFKFVEYASLILKNFVESYMFTFSGVDILSRKRINISTFIKELLVLCEKAYIEGDIKNKGAISSNTFKNAIEFLVNTQIIDRRNDEIFIKRKNIEKLNELRERLIKYM